MKQPDELIRDWTEELLPPEMDEQITYSLLDFVDNDDTVIDVKDLLDFHIHKLAMEERVTWRSKWKILIASVAAASVVLLVIATTLFSSKEHDHHGDAENLAVENSAEETTTAIDRGFPTTIAEATDGRIDHSTKGQGLRCAKKRERAMKQKKETPELILTETLAEIKAGFVSMADNTMESLNMTNESLVPVNLSSDYYEPNIIEANLINALYEIRNLNIELNFETDNKTTEI